MGTDNTSIGPIDEPDISAEYYQERYGEWKEIGYADDRGIGYMDDRGVTNTWTHWCPTREGTVTFTWRRRKCDLCEGTCQDRNRVIEELGRVFPDGYELYTRKER